MKKIMKVLIPLVSVLCVVFFAAFIVTAKNYSDLIRSSKRPSNETYTDHLKLCEKLDHIYIEGKKYIRMDNSYQIPEHME